MLPELQHFKNSDNDMYTFFAEEEGVQVRASVYIDPGVPVGGTELGDKYSIILMQEHPEEDRYHKIEHFEAILADPLEYISGLIPAGWMGIIAKKTTTSDEFVEKVVDCFNIM